MTLITLIGICFTSRKLVLHVGFIPCLFINSAIHSPDIYRGLTMRQAQCGHLVCRGESLTLSPVPTDWEGEIDGAQWMAQQEGLS